MLNMAYMCLKNTFMLNGPEIIVSAILESSQYLDDQAGYLTGKLDKPGPSPVRLRL
jgi:hypothetical protein